MNTPKQHSTSEVQVEGDRNITINGSGNNVANTSNFFSKTQALPSNLASIVNVLGKRLFEEQAESINNIFSIEDKIQHNNVQTYKYTIESYGILVGKLTAVYNEFDASGTDFTRNTLANINLIYTKVRNEYLMINRGRILIDVVREFADEIFIKVEEKLFIIIRDSSNIKETHESVNMSLQVIMIDAFIKCQILEKPSNASA